MRHNKSGRKLGRNPSHRKALFKNMAKAILTHGRITTTEAKAKTLRGVVEPLITLALKNDLHARREAYRFLGEHKLVKRLFDEIGPLFAGGGGGYTRVVKMVVPRKGDAAPMAIIELTKMPPVVSDEPKPRSPKAEAAKKERQAKAAARAGDKPATKKAAAKPKAEAKPKAAKPKAKAEAQGDEAPKKPRAPRKKKEDAAE